MGSNTPQYSHNHIVNPETGFLENPAFINQFDSARKIAFLELYKKNGLRLRRASRDMGLSEDTVYRAIRNDPVFKKAFEDVEKDHLEELESVSATNALNPKSVIERIFRLKCLLPEKYGQENKPSSQTIIFNIDAETLKQVQARSKVIDTEEIISTQPIEMKNADNQADRVIAISDKSHNAEE